jgi:uncharacterized membrane protein YhaH (DUF805 family)
MQMEKWLERRFRLAGRATRREYAIAMIWLYAVLVFIDRIDDSGSFENSLTAVILVVLIICVAFWIPIAAMVRRLHDIGLSGWWWWLIICVPFGQIGLLLLLFVGPDRFSQTRFYRNPRRKRVQTA